MPIRGACLCGEVRYEIDGKLLGAGNCHCSMCRKAHGAAFATYANVDPESFRWVCGEDLVAFYESSPNAGRSFCRKCGSTLGASEGGRTYVTLGTVEGDPGIRPSVHIFVGSIAPWYEIEDEMPQFDEDAPPGEWA